MSSARRFSLLSWAYVGTIFVLFIYLIIKAEGHKATYIAVKYIQYGLHVFFKFYANKMMIPTFVFASAFTLIRI